MKKINLFFWDFDGTICDSPLPETHKHIWQQVTGMKWPYQGWWSKVETLDNTVFDIQLIESNIITLKNNISPDNKHYVLTARLKRFEDNIKAILTQHGIKHLFSDIFTVTKLDKGQMILQFIINKIKEGYTIGNVNFFDDRDKEIVATENVRQDVEKLIKGNYNITKV